MQVTPRLEWIRLLQKNRPQAVAWIQGNEENPQLSGLIKFYTTIYGGVLVEAEVFGLPNIDAVHSSDFYAMHIHENGDCSGEFANTGGHYDPAGLPHPDHAGDMLPLMGDQGYAYTLFYDKRFRVSEIVGKSVIIHAGKDDFSTQPSGNAGEKIGCGVIMEER